MAEPGDSIRTENLERSSPRPVCTLFTSPTLPPLPLRLNPLKVRAFLDPLHGWDPSLAFVMGGAVAVNLLLFRFILCEPQPRVCPAFCVPTNNREITADLVVGAALFGIGEGMWVRGTEGGSSKRGRGCWEGDSKDNIVSEGDAMQ